MITYYEDYLYSFDLKKLDNKKLSKECLQTESYLKQYLLNKKEDNFFYGSFTTSHYNDYNLFTFPVPESIKLYEELKKYCYPFLDLNVNYWIQCWVNIFRKGDFIDWHGHWGPEYNVWHGFYCVDVGNSFTEYKIPNVKDIIKVPSKESRLIFGKSNGDRHKSSKWDNDNKPRITIAFDIVPYTTLIIEDQFSPNHFLPFK